MSHSQSRKTIKYYQIQNSQKLSNLKNNQIFISNNANSNYNQNQQSSDFLKSIYLEDYQRQNPRQARDQSRSKSRKPQKQRNFSKSKKNQLSCQQILTILKKRDTHSALQNQSHQSSQQSNKIKPKKKKVKKPTIMMAHKSINYQSDINLNYNLGYDDQTINYPLSKSNSFIVFSDKDTTMNTTFLKSKVITISKKDANYINEFKEKNKIKPNQAAILIQKTWRGYLTRKLLQQYIVDEQPRLEKALNNFRSLSSSSAQNNSQKNLLNQNFFQIKDFFEHHESDKKLIKQQYLITKQINVSELSSIGEINICNMAFNDVLNNSKILNSTIKRSVQNDRSIILGDLLLGTPQQKRRLKYEQKSCQKHESLSKQMSCQYHQQNVLFSQQHNQQQKQQELQQQNQFSQQQLKDCFKKQSSILQQQNLNLKITQRKQNVQIDENTQKKLKSDNIYQQTKRQKNNLQKIQNQTKLAAKQSIIQLKKQMKIPIMPLKISSTHCLQKLCQKKKFQISKSYQLCFQINEKSKNLKEQKEQKQLQTNIFQAFKEIQTFFNKKTSQKRIDLKKKLSQNSISFDQHMKQSKRIKKLYTLALQKLNQVKEFQKIYDQALKYRVQQNKENEYYQSFKENKEKINIYSCQINQLKHKQERFKKPTAQVFIFDDEQNDSPLKALKNQQLSKNSQGYNNAGYQQLKYYISSIVQQMSECAGQISQLQFLCELLRKHTQTGAQNMIERCLIQFLVQLITGQFHLQDVLKVINDLIDQHSLKNLKINIDINNTIKKDNVVIQNEITLRDLDKSEQIRKIIQKWGKQLNKWNLDIIQQVSHIMQSSSFFTEGNDKTFDKDTLKSKLEFFRDQMSDTKNKSNNDQKMITPTDIN